MNNLTYIVPTLFGLGGKLGQNDHHPLTGPQADVGLGQGIQVTGEEDPAVFYPDIFHIQSAQLIAGQSLQTK